jgi:hypothetical protein
MQEGCENFRNRKIKVNLGLESVHIIGPPSWEGARSRVRSP